MQRKEAEKMESKNEAEKMESKNDKGKVGLSETTEQQMCHSGI